MPKDKKVNEIKINIFRYLFAEEAKLHNELVSAELNYNVTHGSLELFELLEAKSRFEAFQEFSERVAILLNS